MELTTTKDDADLGMDQAAPPHKVPKPAPYKGQREKRLTRLKVNLSTPLLVKTEAGENMAGPGDVVGHFGRHDVMMSKDLFIALLGREKYDDLVRKEMLKIRIAKRKDDQQPDFTDEELEEQKQQIEEVMKAKEESFVDYDPNDLNMRIQVIDSSEGPPTIKPDQYATIIPGPMLPIPEDVIEDERKEEKLPDKAMEVSRDQVESLSQPEQTQQSENYQNPFLSTDQSNR